MNDPGNISMEVVARRGAGTMELILRLDIPQGTHIEAHEPSDPLLIPTVAEFTNLEVTNVDYPNPVEKHLGLPGPPLLVYEGTVCIIAQGRADASLRAVRGTIRYQPCVGGACLPPREQAWEAPVESA